ncbi:hypothetical protein EG68_01553 [Paragonimus skrjabini miyazakii]|uniref:Uncharacterized protein n=1 Tax=Paragonimus skrjabini miyazakii TaxID=59628 RepID=A0A8S9ZAR1_9TREM|nr:hypothetical protein EG68_01553 [Paragonimus skrjabini miyazakii]
MANIYARDAVGQYFDDRLINEFISNPLTYVSGRVDEIQDFEFVLKDFVKTFDPLMPVHPRSYSPVRKLTSINITQVGCSYTRRSPEDHVKLLAVCYYNHPTGYFLNTLDYPVGDKPDCGRTGNETNIANSGRYRTCFSSSTSGRAFASPMFRPHWYFMLCVLSVNLYLFQV